MSSLVAPSKSQVRMVGMGQIEIARGPDHLGSILGSCVAICLFATKQKIGAMAHVVMPNSLGNVAPPGKSADTAVPHLLKVLGAEGVRKDRIVARLAGGASMFKMSQSGFQIGQANIQAASELLANHGIRVVGRDLGGDKGRRIVFDCLTGQVKVEIIGSQPIFI